MVTPLESPMRLLTTALIGCAALVASPMHVRPMAQAPLATVQTLPTLRIKAVLTADGQPSAVARHALLISDDPVSAAPRRVITLADGTVQVRLRPGRYIVESDRPFAWQGQQYEWTVTVEMPAQGDVEIELTAANANVSGSGPGMGETPAVDALDPRERANAVLASWQASVFGLWTPHTHASGFLADERGLVATSYRALGQDADVEVQLSATRKVRGVVTAADATTDVAIIRVHPSAIAGISVLPMTCDAAPASAASAPNTSVPDTAAPNTAARDTAVADTPSDHARVYTLTATPFSPIDIESSLVVSKGSAGGPVFDEAGRAIGLSSPVDDADTRRRTAVRVVGGSAICQTLASARATQAARPSPGATPPDAAPLPIEPPHGRAFGAPGGPGTSAPSARGSFALTAYQLTSQDFDVTFITPVVLAAADQRRGYSGGRAAALSGLRVATDFAHWADYVADAPPLLYVRATPRTVEGFWSKLARGAASTQGAALPPITRLRPGFSHMRLLCGDTEVAPIHPFRIQARLTETDAIEEGFYVFDPDAIGPACGTVSLVLASVKDPARAETRVVDPPLLRRVRDEFAHGPSR